LGVVVTKVKMHKPTALNTWRACRNPVCSVMEKSNEAVNHGQPQSMYHAELGHSLPDNGDEFFFFLNFINLTTLITVHSFSSFVCDENGNQFMVNSQTYQTDTWQHPNFHAFP
jgi:hypothetical protein